jgi:hypothetical protein
LDRKNRQELQVWSLPLSQNTHLPDTTDACIPTCHVINAKTLAQHVCFEELPSGFDSGSLGVVVFFYNRPVVMEKAP